MKENLLKKLLFALVIPIPMVMTPLPEAVLMTNTVIPVFWSNTLEKDIWCGRKA